MTSVTYPSSRLEPRVGSLGCPGIDVTTWQKANRAPVYPGQTNHWLFAVAAKADATDADLVEDLHKLFWAWFANKATDTFIWSFETEFEAGTADNVRIIKASSVAWRLATPTARRENLPGPLPIVATAKNVIYVELSFTYRGQLTDVAWPTFTEDTWTPSGKLCPIGADWILLDVGPATADAPKARSIAEKITSGVTTAAKDLVTGITSGLGLGSILAVGLGGLLLYGWATRNK